MKTVAVIGSGISGMGAAYALSGQYAVTLYEKNEVIGGHARTKEVDFGGEKQPVDTGFIVFNQVNYPELVGLFSHLKVPTEKSTMTFAFTQDKGAFEWGAASLNAVFGQRRNVFNPAYYKMIADVKRFFAASQFFVDADEKITLAQMLTDMKMGKWFIHRFILPMGAAIWSASPDAMLEFPARTFVRFFSNHGLLSFSGQHQWYTVTGGSREYVKRLMAKLNARIKLGVAVSEVRSDGETIIVSDDAGQTERYDHVVFASHADETLHMLKDATPQERAILGEFHYSKNTAFLHSDASVMPRRKRCWASWVYSTSSKSDNTNVSVTYWMNALQNIDPVRPLFVTLNPASPINPELIHDKHEFTHPIFTKDAIAAQGRLLEIQGKRNIWFCGAYQRYGFHEDGLMSAVAVAKRMGATIPWH